jgi:hypothetical protein
MSAELKRVLEEKGWVWARNRTIDTYREWMRSLGTAFHATDVKLEPGSGQYALRPEAFEMHMDNPDADYAGWYVVNDGGEASCPMLISDSRAALNALPLETLQGLASIETLYIDVATRKKLAIPLLGRDERGNWFARYFPYDVRRIEAKSEQQARWLCELRECLAALPIIELPVATGDAVILDNNRMMHGRRGMRPGSLRRLFRVWVTRGDKYDSLQRAA